ncbi:4-alpha-L-fucosyltransferase [Lonepinella koalarum]|uniref:TDP-N-acetylfucosamine:lipid II N-acetylfucosaminyltransferase n=1 Tax=Lonepinella koalarum TaxID=53417 RepID=UPI0011E47D2C|nr:TDP-N-acetylfucosamine:lipid II N-acetylfucosaminyltransferase [Lonepinella koalarum]TYG35500.1 4-alpha-L-fucosyltransferase [Lonepinella koalarum]
MKQIIHVLGSPIPHHNHTMLRFLAEQLQPQLPKQAIKQVLVVGSGYQEQYPSLYIQEFDSKKSIAQAVCQLAKHDPQHYFYLHGQFNFPLWIAILLGKLPPDRLTWQMWGADLHQDSQQWKFKLAYPLRRFVQKKLISVAGYQGDLTYFKQHINPNVQGHLVYFPSKMHRSFQAMEKEKQKSDKLTILLGNSGDPSNRHLVGLEQIKQQLGDNVRIIIPMGYPEHNGDYIAQVSAQATRLFAQSAVQILTEKMPFQDYLALLNQCDVAYFIFQRQQGVGSLCLLTQFNVPVVLHPKNTFIEDMRLYQVPFLLQDQVSEQRIRETQQKLTALDKETIGFFEPHFMAGWLAILTQILQQGEGNA